MQPGRDRAPVPGRGGPAVGPWARPRRPGHAERGVVRRPRRRARRVPAAGLVVVPANTPIARPSSRTSWTTPAARWRSATTPAADAGARRPRAGRRAIRVSRCPTRIRRRSTPRARCAGADRLHLGHDGPAEGRRALAREPARERRVAAARVALDRRATASCCALPLFHMHGLGVGPARHAHAGASAVLHAGFRPGCGVARDPASTTRRCSSACPRCTPGSSSAAGAPERCAGCACACRARRRCPRTSTPRSSALSGQRILERYGMTETVMLVSNPVDGERRPGTVGLPLPGVEVRLDGQPAQIEVRGPNVFAGYWQRPDANARRSRRRLVPHRRSRRARRGRVSRASPGARRS